MHYHLRPCCASLLTLSSDNAWFRYWNQSCCVFGTEIPGFYLDLCFIVAMRGGADQKVHGIDGRCGGLTRRQRGLSSLAVALILSGINSSMHRIFCWPVMRRWKNMLQQITAGDGEYRNINITFQWTLCIQCLRKVLKLLTVGHQELQFYRQLTELISTGGRAWSLRSSLSPVGKYRSAYTKETSIPVALSTPPTSKREVLAWVLLKAGGFNR